MKALKFVKGPGHIYDLFYIFTFYFNQQYCLKYFLNFDKTNEDKKFFYKLLEDALPIPDELLLFFYLGTNKKTFITKLYYEPYEGEFLDTYGLGTVQDALNNYDQVISNVLSFYFKDASQAELQACKNSIGAVDQLIKKSDYDAELKNALYSFFISPVQVIQKLSYELMAKDFLLSQYYDRISVLQNQLDVKQLSAKLKKLSNLSINIDGFSNIFVSWCFYFKNCIKIYYFKDTVLLILGTDCQEYADYLIKKNILPELSVFGNAVSEQNRVDLLDFMLKKDEITIKDIEQELGFTGTNAYYHLSLMIKAGIINTRNQGRTVFYSLNKRYFDVLCNMLSKYSNRKEHIE